MKKYTVGVLRGEGVGYALTECALSLLDVFPDVEFDIQYGGTIGTPAQIAYGTPLTQEVIDFCQDIFDVEGAILCGPGGGRFVYDLRKRFDLFLKFTPIRPYKELKYQGVLTPEAKKDVDILILRDNIGGMYQGDWGYHASIAYHTFYNDPYKVYEFLKNATLVAYMREKKKLTVMMKPCGFPSIYKVWQEAISMLPEFQRTIINIVEADNGAYQLINNAQDFDVIACPNMFGDIISDVGSLLLGSRGMSFSMNISYEGNAVYQTAHGAAHDLNGKDVANPIGQIESLAEMLGASFGLSREANLIRKAIGETLRKYRTKDIVDFPCVEVGTKAMTQAIRDEMEKLI